MSETRRPLPLSILLVAIFLLNALGVARGIVLRDGLMREIPNFTPSWFAIWCAAQALAAIGAAGLWQLRRWGLYLLAVSWAMSAVADVRLGATGHAILVTGTFGLVLVFVQPVRAELR